MFTTSILKQKACDAMGTSIERPFGHINFLESKSRPKSGIWPKSGQKGQKGIKSAHKMCTKIPL